MSAFSFHAERVVVEHPDREFHLVGFADKQCGTEIYLMLQRSHEDGVQDIELGMNTFHVEWCDQEKSGYGGIAQFVLRPDSAEVHLEPKMAQLFGGTARLSITFELQASEYLALQEALRRIFAGSKCLEFADA